MATEQRGVVFGIDLGGTKALIGVVDAAGKVLAREKIASQKGAAPALLSAIAAAARRALGAAGLPQTAVRAAGIGMPGPVNLATGVVEVAPNLGWQNVPVKELLQRELGVPVVVDNDVRVATHGEHQLGAGKGYSRLVALFVGTGIGGGLVTAGQLDRGAHEAAGEIGHTFVAVGGPACSAGHRGCLEAMASRSAMRRDLADAISAGKKSVLKEILKGDLAELKSSQLVQAYDRDDRLTQKVVHRAARYVGFGLASTINLLDPELIILGGGVVEALGDRFTKPALKVARANIIAASARQTPILRAALGDDAGMLGAALLAWRLAPPQADGAGAATHPAVAPTAAGGH